MPTLDPESAGFTIIGYCNVRSTRSTTCSLRSNHSLSENHAYSTTGMPLWARIIFMVILSMPFAEASTLQPA